LHAPTIANGCIVEYGSFGLGNSDLVFVNDQGAIAFSASLFSDSGVQCPFDNAVVYQNGGHSIRFDGELSLDTDTERFADFTSLAGFSDDGSVFVFVESFSNGQQSQSVWEVDSAGTQELVILSGETLPPDFQQPVNFDAFSFDSSNVRRTFDTASGGQVAIIAESTNGSVLLTGAARPLPYTDIFSPGASQLERIVDSNQSTVPGLDESSFFNQIDDVLITNNNTVWFRGIAEDRAGQVSDRSGIWNAVPGSNASPVVDFSIEFSVDTQRVSLTEIISYDVNKQGDVVAFGQFSDSENFDVFSRDVVIYRRGSN